MKITANMGSRRGGWEWRGLGFIYIILIKTREKL